MKSRRISGARRVRASAAVALALVGFAATGAPAGAVSLSLVPSAASVGAGASFGVDVLVAGLGTGVEPALRAFDLDVLFDPALLGLEGVAFDVYLGEPEVEALVDWKELPVGVADFAENSLVPGAELVAEQPDAFRLARIAFTALAPGEVALDFGPGLLVGLRGVTIPLANATGTRVTITPAIPEPGAFLVFAAGLLLVVRRAPAR